jgi:hypothetical protein
LGLGITVMRIIAHRLCDFFGLFSMF